MPASTIQDVFLRYAHPSSLGAALAQILRCRASYPPLASRSRLLARANGRRCSNSEFCNQNDARARTFLELLFLPPRRTVVRCASSGRALAGDPPGKATSFCVVVWRTPFGVPRLFARSRVSRPAPALSSSSRSCREPDAGFRRSAAYVDGARHCFTARRPVPRLSTHRRTTRHDFAANDVGRGL